MKQVLHPVCNHSGNPRLITFFSSNIWHRREPAVHWQAPCTGYCFQRLAYFTCSCLFLLTPCAEYLGYESFQPRILTLCLLKPDMCQSEHIRSKLMLIFLSLTCTVISGISTKHRVLLQEKNPTATPRMTTGAHNRENTVLCLCLYVPIVQSTPTTLIHVNPFVSPLGSQIPRLSRIIYQGAIPGDRAHSRLKHW